MKIVNDWGELFKMSERKYRQFLRAGAAGKEPEACKYGKCIGVVAFNSVDVKPRDYQFALDGLEKP